MLNHLAHQDKKVTILGCIIPMIKEDLEAKVLEMTTGLAFKVLPRVVIKLCF